MGTLMEILKKVKEPLVEERIPARCSVTKESFDILLGHEKGKLTMLRGERNYNVDVANSSRDGAKAEYKKINLTNGLQVGRTYHCPVCGNKDIVRCGKCRRVTCAMTERGTLPVHTAVILARYLELWTVLRLMTAVV